MTTTCDPVADEAAANVDRSLRAIREAMPNLPTVEELATPILRTIYALESLNDLAWHLEFLSDDERTAADATVFVELIDGVAALVEAAVGRCLRVDEGQRRLAAAARETVYAVAGATHMRAAHYGQRAYALAEAPHSLPPF